LAGGQGGGLPVKARQQEMEGRRKQRKREETFQAFSRKMGLLEKAKRNF